MDETDEGPAMLRNEDALATLEAAANQPETNRSSFWDVEVENFRVAADGTRTGVACIGNISRKTGRLYTLMHRVLQLPFRYMARGLPDYADCERLGRIIAKRQERQYTSDMMRQALSLALIRHHLPDGPGAGANLVIGDGYGVMTSLLRLAWPDNKTIAVNLTIPLLADLAFASQALPGMRLAMPANMDEMAEALGDPAVDVIGIRADDAGLLEGVQIGLAINIHSMQEMDMTVIAEYFRLLRSSTGERTAFYCCNRVQKKFYDGTEIRFDAFPWRDDDKLLVDETCPWTEWLYGPKPPFWTRMPTPVHHRLALIDRPVA